MAGRLYNTKTEIKKGKKTERYGLSRDDKRRLTMRILVIYLIIDTIVHVAN